MMYLDVAADGCFVILCLQAFGYRFGKIPLNASTTSSWCWAVQQNFRVTCMRFMQKCQVVIEFVPHDSECRVISLQSMLQV